MTGINQNLLRTWERRFNFLKPVRSESGRCLYSDQDVITLRKISNLIVAGWKIGDIALMDLKGQDYSNLTNYPTNSVNSNLNNPEEIIESALSSIRVMDEKGLNQILTEAAINFSRPILRHQILSPMLNRIGEEWANGSLRISHEHMASGVVRSFLAGQKLESGTSPHEPRIIMTTPTGHLHEFGALIAAEEAEDHGWNPIYLGPNLPAVEIIAAKKQSGSLAIGLSLVFPPNQSETTTELISLRSGIGKDTPILIGGRAAESYRDVISKIGGILVNDLVEFVKQLQLLNRT